MIFSVGEEADSSGPSVLVDSDRFDESITPERYFRFEDWRMDDDGYDRIA
jgi:hypothetical protein